MTKHKAQKLVIHYLREEKGYKGKIKFCQGPDYRTNQRIQTIVPKGTYIVREGFVRPLR